MWFVKERIKDKYSFLKLAGEVLRGLLYDPKNNRTVLEGGRTKFMNRKMHIITHNLGRLRKFGCT